MSQLDKIPQSASLIAEWHKPETPTTENLAETVRVYQAYKSHGYQTDYQPIPVYLFAIQYLENGVKHWDVKEKRESTGKSMFWKIVSQCDKLGMVRVK